MLGRAEAQTWILLRGLAREKAHWGPFLEHFAASVPGDEVLAMDLPGVGEFLDVPSPKTMGEILNFVRGQAVARASRPGRFKLVAVSLGGMVVMEWLRQKPDDLSLCVLINSSSRSLSPFYNRLRWQIWPRFMRLITIQSARERERAIIELLMNSEGAKDAALPLWTRLATERPISYLNFLNQLKAAANFQGLENGGSVPTLLLSGLGDRLVDPSCSTQMHTRLGWLIQRHPWAGHDLPWDDPQWVIDKIVQFDRKNS